MRQTPLRSRPVRAAGTNTDTARLAMLAREGTELNRDDFARVLGVPPAMVGRWELGAARPSAAEQALLRAIAATPEVCLLLIHGEAS